MSIKLYDETIYEDLMDKIAKGDTRAMIKLGLGYLKGSNYVTEINYVKAAELFNKAAENGDSDGYIYLYKMCVSEKVLNSEDNTPLINYDKAKGYIEKAHFMGNDEATLLLGFSYLNGMFLEADSKKAKECFETLINHKYILDEEYETTLPNLIKTCDTLEGFVEAGDYNEKFNYNVDYNFKSLSKLAEQNDAVAMYELAIMYGSGKGCKRDSNKELELLLKSAKLGFGTACLELAITCTLQPDVTANQETKDFYNPNIGGFFLIKGMQYHDVDCILRLADSYTLGDMGVLEPRLALKLVNILDEEYGVDKETLDQYRHYAYEMMK